MKNVLLKQLELRNFKGIKSISIPFTKETEIHGKNGVGKTTIADAYFWLLYGKNSLDQTDFEIKTLDSQNKAIPKLEHEVIGFLEVDGEEIKLAKIFREKWVKKRGSETEEMSGHETTYFVNDVPTSAGDYKKKVSEIIEESISKIITNPTFFNEKMKWQDRRVMLSTMAGEVTDKDITDSLFMDGNNYSELIEIMNSGKILDDEKKIIGAKKKKIKDEIDQIPSRLDEINRQRPEESNWPELQKESSQLIEDIKSKTDKIDNINKAIQSQKDEILAIQKSKFEKEQELDRLSREQTSKSIEGNASKERRVIELKRNIENLDRLIESETKEIEETKAQILIRNTQNAVLRDEIGKVSSLSFQMDESKSCCPTCKRSLDNASEIEEQLRANFNKDKIEKVEEINKKGLLNKESIENNNKRILFYENSIAENKKQRDELIESLKSPELIIESPSIKIEPTPEMIQLQKEIQAIEIPEIHSEDISLIRSEIQEIEERKRKIDGQLNTRTQIEGIDNRSNELKEKQKTLSQELASLEKIEMQIDRFNKEKINFIESRINSKFKFVKFKMFEEQLNGGEAPACECIVDGVPYSSLNTAMRLNASLDIINAFQYHFGIFAPVFIDGRESITTLIPMECQIISLVVNSNEEIIKIVNV